MRKESSGKVMADLYEFPYWNEQMAIKELGLDLSFVKDLEHQTHGFTRFRVELVPTLWVAREKEGVPGYEWIFLEQLGNLPFSSGHRRSFQVYFSFSASVRSVSSSKV